MKTKKIKSLKIKWIFISIISLIFISDFLLFTSIMNNSNSVPQNINKVIVAVPERTIGSSFKQTDLKSYGFFENWNPSDKSNLCLPGNDGSKSRVSAFKEYHNDTVNKNFNDPKITVGIDDKEFENFLKLSEKL